MVSLLMVTAVLFVGIVSLFPIRPMELFTPIGPLPMIAVLFVPDAAGVSLDKVALGTLSSEVEGRLSSADED